MTLLQVMPEEDSRVVRVRTTDATHIQRSLADVGVRFDRWQVQSAEPGELDPATVLASYADDVRALRHEGGYELVDVAHMTSVAADPESVAKAAAARAKFLDEHRHDEDEVRFFARGRGCFYLRLDGHVHAVVCGAGDLLAVPAGTLHWFDTGTRPEFTAVRFFEREDGWVGDFSGDRISGRFPSMEQLVTG